MHSQGKVGKADINGAVMSKGAKEDEVAKKADEKHIVRKGGGRLFDTPRFEPSTLSTELTEATNGEQPPPRSSGSTPRREERHGHKGRPLRSESKG